MQAVFDIGLPIFGTKIWAYPILILSEAETIKRNSSFFIKSATYWECNNEKIINKYNE